MARPTKTEDNKRTHSVEVCFTAAEKQTLKIAAKAQGKTVSDYIRGLAINAKPSRNVPTPNREILLKALAELNMNGSNLNQIARVLNSKQGNAGLVNIPDYAITTAIYGVDALTKHIMQLLK